MRNLRKKHLPKALIFDIDGTLLDVSGSFYATTIEVSEAWWKIYEKDSPPFKPDIKLIEVLKSCPGFNDDWEMTIAIVLLQKWILGRNEDPIELVRKVSPKGLSDLEGKIGLRLPSEKKELIKRMCMEIYGGKECDMLYGFKPSLFVGREGLWTKERPLFDLSETKGKFILGIYTGRNPKETKLALKLLNLRLPQSYIVTSAEFRKPDPRGLFKLVYEMGVDCAAFIGDSGDDRLAVLNYKKRFRFPFIDFIDVKDFITLKTFGLEKL